MARTPQAAPNRFATLIALAVKREIGIRRMSGRALARRLSKSESYVRDRLNGRFEFTLNDIENFCLYIGQNPESWIADIERDPALLERLEREYADIEARRPRLAPVARTIDELDKEDELAARRRRGSNVGRPAQNDDDLGTIDEDDLVEKYDTAANRDHTQNDIDPETTGV